jgi:hypothetical protein
MRPDSIPNWFYGQASSSLKVAVLHLFSTSFTQGIFPSRLKLSNLIPIPKPGKDHTLPDGYRPISLISTLSRIFERIIHRSLTHYCEANNILQNAFRCHSSSIDPSLSTKYIHTGFNRAPQHPTVMVQLDTSKAFDTVWLAGLRYKLRQIGLKGRLLAWLTSFIENRAYRVVTPEITQYRLFTQGVPQGSVLSPLLFIIFIADCPAQLRAQHAEFADDFTLWNQGAELTDTLNVLQQDLREIERWAKKWRICFHQKNAPTHTSPVAGREPHQTESHCSSSHTH